MTHPSMLPNTATQLTILQQNANKSLNAQLDSLHTLPEINVQNILLQEPYKDRVDNTMALPN